MGIDVTAALAERGLTGMVVVEVVEVRNRALAVSSRGRRWGALLT